MLAYGCSYRVCKGIQFFSCITSKGDTIFLLAPGSENNSCSCSSSFKFFFLIFNFYFIIIIFFLCGFAHIISYTIFYFFTFG